MNKTTIFFVTVFLSTLVSCNKDRGDNGNEVDPNAAIVLTVDGKTRTISAAEREADDIVLDEYPIKTLFRKKGDGQQFEVNLNFYERDILGKIPITYTLPQDHHDQVKIDLNFFDLERDVEKNIYRRLVFDKGVIKIYKLSEDNIHFDFEGEVYELTNDESRSSVSGSVNVNY